MLFFSVMVEFFVFGVAGSLVVWEYDRSKKKEAKKEEKVEVSILDVRINVDDKLNQMQDKIDKLEESIVAMNNNIEKMGRQQEEQNANESKQRRWLW